MRKTDPRLTAMQADEDIASEAAALSGAISSLRLAKGDGPAPSADSTAMSHPLRHVPLNWASGQGGHRPSADTRLFLTEAGGSEAIRAFTNIFYRRAFADPHVDKFIRDHKDPHGERFASWILEKFGDGMPWSTERSTRKVCPYQAHGHTFDTPHDRSSAHFAAWHSPKREAQKFGQHFKLDDCRMWMRLHFWAFREAGIAQKSPSFFEYYVKFIGHFVSVYERSATTFARESARWSASSENTKFYMDNGNRMADNIIGVGLQEALRTLPEEERGGDWPYV